MEQLIIRRSAVEGRLRRISTRVNAMDPNRTRIDDVNAEFESLQEMWRDFRSIHSGILDLCANLEAIEEHLDCEQDIERRYNKLKATIAQFQRVLNRRDNSDLLEEEGSIVAEIRDHPGTTLSAPELHLPKGILPTFSGDYGEWNSFYDLFMSAVHNNPRLTNAQRLFYLKTYTDGRAAALLKHIKIEDSAYEGAMEALKKRFDRKDQIVNHHIQRFFDIPASTGNSVVSLRRIHDTADDVRRALEALHREERDSWLIYLLLTKLDADSRQQWIDKTAEDEFPATLEEFLVFLDQRSYAMETANSSGTKSGCKQHPKPTQRRSNNFLVASESAGSAGCAICHGPPHPAYYCQRLKEIPVEDRIRIIKQLGLCQNCLRSKHGNGPCQHGACKKCKQNHHTILHDGIYERQLSFPVSSNLSYNQAFTSVFLATAVVDVIDAYGKSHPVRALLDSASQASFITAELSKQLGFKPYPINMPLRGISGLSTRITEATKVTIHSRRTTYTQSLDCAILPKISDPIPHTTTSISDWMLPADDMLADANFNIPGNIDMLIGAGIFYQILEAERLSLGPAKPVLQKTALGWVVAGFYDTTLESASSPICFVSAVEPIDEPDDLNDLVTRFCLMTEADPREAETESLQELVSRFWQLETIGPVKHLTEEEKTCEEHYQQHTRREENGRYVVKLPFKADPVTIGQTGYAALHQFNSLIGRMRWKNPEKYHQYCDYISDYITSGYATRILPVQDPGTIIYLPHHAVIKEESSTTKLRVVFNASQKSSNGLSLNNILMTGPVIQKTLFHILLNFRLHRVALTGDIEKMYLQVRVADEDSQLIRMLWQEPGQPLAEYTMNTITFGTSCAPYLATRTLRQLAEDDGDRYPIAVKSIDDFYVDDCLTGAPTIEEAIEKRRQLTELMKGGGFTLRKWTSNEPAVLADLEASERAVDPARYFDSEASLKTLGVRWQFREDLFTFSVTCDPIQEFFVKREVLSTIARIFDPLGLIGPVTILAKIFMQEIWKIKIDWSDPLPNAFNHRWRTYLSHLRDIWKVKVPRRCIGIQSATRILLHGYCDASGVAYGAVLYIRAIDSSGNFSSRLLCSKSKVTPINSPTIPRLELCAAVLLAQLIQTSRNELQIEVHEILAHSDSTVTLAWLAGEAARWKPFVGNRVSQVNAILPSANWRHIPTDQNPADLLSRGTAPSVLAASSLWWYGPRWMENDSSKPVAKGTELRTIEREQRKTYPVETFIVTESNDSVYELINKLSSYTRIQRAVGWIIRFIENCQVPRIQRYQGPLAVVELTAGRNMLIRAVQQQAYASEIDALRRGAPISSNSKILPLTPILVSDILRVGGRLEYSGLQYEERHPILLPNNSRLAKIIFQNIHLQNHHLGPQSLLATVRRNYWIPQGRKLARNTVWNCVPCHKGNPNRGLRQQIMGHLPSHRVTPAPPFSICGVDYGGPITLIQRRGPGSPSTKGYIAIFVCFVTRAVHIEAVSSLSTRAFLAALRRFVSRRGHCSHMYSDRGTNFIGAAREMKAWYEKIGSQDHNNRVADYLSQGGTQWHFNPPGSPHMGGLWEAAIKSAKLHLYRITHKARLTFEEFHTLLTEIEGILNSRPISPASNDPNDTQPLTPGHFLIGRPLTANNEKDYLPAPDVPYDKRYKYIHELRNHFWARWRLEYLPELQVKGKWCKVTDEIHPGDLVLIRKQKLPSQQWNLGRVLKLHEAPDGHTRLVTVKTSTAEVIQSVHNISKLPMGN